MVARVGESWGGRVKKMERLRSTNLLFQNSRGDVKYSIGNRVSDTVITVYVGPGGTWNNGAGGTLCKVYDCLTTVLYTWN